MPRPPRHPADADGAVSRYREPLIRYFVRRGVSGPAAEDLAQDCFTRLFALSGRDHIENEEAYLFQTASSVFTDFLRRARSRESSKHISLDAGFSEEKAAEVPGPDRVLEGKENLARLKAALKALHPKTREIFLLNRLDGLTYTQIAVRFAMTTSGVEKHMIKALAHIRKHLGDVFP